MEFGEIYRIPKNRHKNLGIAGHWVVILYADKQENRVYFQTLGSRIFKIFPNFGSLTNKFCGSCFDYTHLKAYEKYKKNPKLYLDVDNIIFLNFNKFKFLSRETFICFKEIEKDNFFDFEQKVKNKIYPFYGNLFKINKRQSLGAIFNSSEIDLVEKNKILNFYKS